VSKGKAGEARDKSCTSIKLEEPDWRRFREMVDRPAVVPDGLRLLFAKPSVFGHGREEAGG
jgi:uncharacterized protein (DUF1778 family)